MTFGLGLFLMVLVHLLGVVSSLQAIMSTRTPQGAVAWGIALISFPYVAVPAYWIFGRSKFDGYEMLRRGRLSTESEAAREALRALEEGGMLLEPRTTTERGQLQLLQSLAKLPATRCNDADLLIDGEKTFDAIFKSIKDAEEYVLVQFYIIHADELGNGLKDLLLEKARSGVRVYLLYDELGSIGLPEEYVRELRDGGVQAAPFNTTKGRGNRFRLNFRNHRKIVVVDGKEAFVGGHNVGDEYLGKDPEMSPWRDTHVAVRGPVVLEAQVTFVEDWQWATDEIPELNWTPVRAPAGDIVSICLPTGPADDPEAGTLVMLDLINVARERLWIATPYFVPDEQFISALHLAALRGVDVRILVPDKNDNLLVDLTHYSYLVEGAKTGLEFHRHGPGFLHQKVMLVDDATAAIGTANFDNRSMRLNFEVTMLCIDRGFAGEVETMLEEDFRNSRSVTAEDYTGRSLPFRIAVNAARLLAPIQ